MACQARSVHTVENVIDAFLEADGNGYLIVREASKKFMTENGAEILKCESFIRLHESQPLLIGSDVSCPR